MLSKHDTNAKNIFATLLTTQVNVYLESGLK